MDDQQETGANKSRKTMFRSLTFSVLGGWILGGISFAAGFVGPIIFAPGANQGPLLGIFVTGPIGCVLGVVLGRFVDAHAAKRNADLNKRV